MSEKFANKQREILWNTHGQPRLALEFDVFEPLKPDDTISVSMWAHTNHAVPFTDMLKAFEAIRDHIQRFIDDKDMCPFNPQFTQNGVIDSDY